MIAWIIAAVVLIVPNIIGPYLIYLAYQRGYKKGKQDAENFLYRPE